MPLPGGDTPSKPFGFLKHLAGHNPWPLSQMRDIQRVGVSAIQRVICAQFSGNARKNTLNHKDLRSLSTFRTTSVYGTGTSYRVYSNSSQSPPDHNGTCQLNQPEE